MSQYQSNALRKALQQCLESKAAVDCAAREQAIAHNAYNDWAVQQPRKGRHSGADIEELRLTCIASYEALLDALRIHSDNLAHAAVLRGKF